MAGGWAALAGAASGFANIKLSDMQRRIEEQEKANEEARALRMQKAKMDMERTATLEDRANTPLYKPERIAGDTDYRALSYGSDGRALELRSFGSAPEGVLAMEQRALTQAEADRERKIRLDEARINKANRPPSSGSGGLTPYQSLQLTRAEEAEQKAALKEAEELALENAGLFKEKGRWMQVPEGKTRPKPVEPGTVASIRAEARRGLLAPDEPEAASELSAEDARRVQVAMQANPGMSEAEVIKELRDRKRIN